MSMLTVTAEIYDVVRDLSLDKLQAVATARREPALRRSVLIANMIRQPVLIMASPPPPSYDCSSNGFFFDEHEPVVPLNYDESTANLINEVEMADNRLAEEAWFDACFAELDDSSEYDNIIADDMVMDDIDMDDSASAADMGSPSEQPPELSPALSDSGYCDGNASDIEAVTPPSLGQPNDSALVDDTSNDAADWWPVSMPVMTQQQQPTTGKPRVVQPCWKINSTSTSTAKSNSTETASPSLWNNWSINNNWT